MIRHLVSLALVVLLAMPAAPAQQPAPAAPAQPSAQAGQHPAAQPGDADAPQGDASQSIIKLGVNEVSLIFTVTDSHGRYIPNLTQNDFALLDDQKAPARVNSFHQQINLPLRVGIVIDASTSIHSRFQFEQQSAIEFLLQVLKAKSDRAFVMGFDVTPTIEQDWTNDMDALETGINRRRRQPEPRLSQRGHQGVRARRDHHLRHQHQLDAQPRRR
jgi:VWFA-related protein